MDLPANALGPRVQQLGLARLGFLFAPWTTMSYVLVAPNGVNGLDLIWIVPGVLVDVASCSWGAWGNRGRTPGRSAA